MSQNEDEVWKLHKALLGYRKAPKMWHQHVVTILESLNFHSLLTDPCCLRNDDVDINIFIHVDDGLLFGPNVELQRLIEHFVTPNHDAYCGNWCNKTIKCSFWAE